MDEIIDLGECKNDLIIIPGSTSSKKKTKLFKKIKTDSKWKGFFWNSDGFKDPNRFISDLTKEQDLSFIGISEIGRRSFIDPF
jgi:hypothetical protein